MAQPLRIKGQEISLRITQDGKVLKQINAIGSFNSTAALELKEDGFLGEPTNRFDDVVTGFGGDFEFQLPSADAIDLEQSVIERAKREEAAIARVFNVIVTEFYADGSSNVIIYVDVKWGAFAKTIGSRVDFVKVKGEFKCSDRTVKTNAVA